MASSIVFANHKGDILIYRRYRDDVSRQETIQFCTKIVATKENKDNPIIKLDEVTFIHTTSNDITLIATTKSNPNVTMLMQFLYHLISICKMYFGGVFNEEKIKDNYVLIYEILDEVMDYGYPQITDYDLLKLYITQGNKSIDITNTDKIKQITIQATNATSWRSENIKYSENKVYIDVIESVNVLISNRDTVLRADVVGQVVMNAELSGMPECKLGINEKVINQELVNQVQSSLSSIHRSIKIEDIKFHQCVRLGKFDVERSITFIPPDGSFELMTYRINENINLPFKLIPIIQETPGKYVEVVLKIRSIFDRDTVATNVIIKIPLPKNCATVKKYSSNGRAKYEPENGGLVWRIKKFPGDFEYLLKCEAYLMETTTDPEWVRPPISIDFVVPMFTSSGLKIQYLRIFEKMDYKPTKWIRYMTKAGTYEQRIGKSGN